jgi:hypothetical protein
MITVYSSIFQKNVQVPVTDMNPMRVLINQKYSVSSHIASKSGPEDESKKLASGTPSPLISPRPIDAPESKQEPKLAEAPKMPIASVTVAASTTVVMQKPICHCSCTC